MSEAEDDEDDTEGEDDEEMEEVEEVEEVVVSRRLDDIEEALEAHVERIETIEKKLFQCSNEAFERVEMMRDAVANALCAVATFQLEDELDREAAKYLESRREGSFVRGADQFFQVHSPLGFEHRLGDSALGEIVAAGLTKFGARE